MEKRFGGKRNRKKESNGKKTESTELEKRNKMEKKHLVRCLHNANVLF